MKPKVNSEQQVWMVVGENPPMWLMGVGVEEVDIRGERVWLCEPKKGVDEVQELGEIRNGATLEIADKEFPPDVYEAGNVWAVMENVRVEREWMENPVAIHPDAVAMVMVKMEIACDVKLK